LLTLAENLAVVLPVENILPTMHEAYERIDLAKTSYALFMAGPSKTADIEQSLVIGAHGAMGMKVFLI
jgi:L-lactate dehydrogenase complex protein LldG